MRNPRRPAGTDARAWFYGQSFHLLPPKGAHTCTTRTPGCARCEQAADEALPEGDDREFGVEDDYDRD